MKKHKNVFIFLFISMFFLSPVKVFAATHDFSLNAYDWDITANDWEGDGTEDPINDGDYLEPGQIFKVDLYYSPGDTKVLGFQAGIKYNPNVVTPIYNLPDPDDPTADVDVYNEMSPGTTASNPKGIWPPKGTTGRSEERRVGKEC